MLRPWALRLGCSWLQSKRSRAVGTSCLETPAPGTPHLNQRHPETEEDPRRVSALEQTATSQVVPLLPLRLATPSALCTPTPDLTGEQPLP